MQSSLLSLATAVPEFLVLQDEAKAIAGRAFKRPALFDRLSGVFDNAGIASRHLVAPSQWYEQEHGWESRNALYLEAAEKLFVQSARAALDRAGLDPADIDGVVTVSTTGIATPSIEARAASRLGLRPDVVRVPLFGLGCAGGVSGLGIVSRLAAAQPGSRWLFVAVETCSISIRLDSDDPAAIVATALFADGAAAAIVGPGPGIARITGAAEHLWPESLRIMGWDVEDPGLAVVFDRAIPPFLTVHLRPVLDGLLDRLGTGRTALDRLCFHPGGAKVVEAIEQSLGLADGSLDLERAILRDHGNMSAPTILFLLDRLIARGLPQSIALTAFGPGFTCAVATLERQ